MWVMEVMDVVMSYLIGSQIKGSGYAIVARLRKVEQGVDEKRLGPLRSVGRGHGAGGVMKMRISRPTHE